MGDGIGCKRRGIELGGRGGEGGYGGGIGIGERVEVFGEGLIKWKIEGKE